MNCCKNTPSEAELAAFKAAQGVYTLLGLAQRAGKLTAGSDAVIATCTRGEAKLVLLAADLSENSLKRLNKLCCKPAVKKNVAVWRFGSKERLGQATGRRPCGVWSLCDVNFAGGLEAKLTALQKAGLAERILPANKNS